MSFPPLNEVTRQNCISGRMLPWVAFLYIWKIAIFGIDRSFPGGTWINPEYSLGGLMLRLKLQYFGHLMWRADWEPPWCWERLKAGEGDDRGQDGWHHWLDMSLSKFWEMVNDKEAWCAAVHGVRVRHDFETEQGIWNKKQDKNYTEFCFFQFY